MKTIGFIDCCIGNWHAASFPKLIRESKKGAAFKVSLVWQETAWEGSKPLDEYCAEHEINQASSLEQVVDECDCICVLSPRNPERHEDLAAYALASGKPVYIDKPFAPSLEMAKRIVDRARQHGSPIMSSSSLRYDAALVEAAEKIGSEGVGFVSVRGGGAWDTYAIHQVEMLVALMGTGAQRVMQVGTTQCPLVIVDYEAMLSNVEAMLSDVEARRRGVINLIPKHPFQLSASYGKDGLVATGNMSDYWPNFIDAVLGFLDTGVSPVPIEQTLEIAAIIEAGTRALEQLDTWIDVPR